MREKVEIQRFCLSLKVLKRPLAKAVLALKGKVPIGVFKNEGEPMLLERVIQRWILSFSV